MYLKSTLQVLKNGLIDSTHTVEIDVKDLTIAQLPNGTTIGHTIRRFGSDKVYAQLIIWSYYKDNKLWNEVLISNSAIENAAGDFTANYVMEYTNPFTQDVLKIERQGCLFYDGTGYLELVGKPEYNPIKSAEDFYFRYFNKLDKTRILEEYHNTYGKLDSLTEYPSASFSPIDGTVKMYDPAKVTHQTGSPRNIGDLWDKACLLKVAVDSGLPTDKLVGNIYGWLSQQARRPVHYISADNQMPFQASEHPKTVMSEFGPSKLWGATDLLGREKFVPPTIGKSSWNSWDHEHLSIDQLVAGYILFGSQYCYLQIRLILEGIMTHPHLKSPKTTISPRVFGWNLRALTWGLLINNNENEIVNYKKAINILLDTYKLGAKYSPIPSVFEQKADPSHLYPTYDDMLKWYDYFSYQLPTSDNYLKLVDLYNITPTDVLNKALAKALVDNLYTAYGYKALLTCLDTWNFVSVFQLAVAAMATAFYNEAHIVGDTKSYEIIQHLMLCLLTKARNQNGTFWYDYGAVLDRTSGTGKETNGVNLWVCGALGMLYDYVPITYKDIAKNAIMSVYNDNKYALPSDVNFYSWMVQNAYKFGYADEV